MCQRSTGSATYSFAPATVPICVGPRSVSRSSLCANCDSCALPRPVQPHTRAERASPSVGRRLAWAAGQVPEVEAAFTLPLRLRQQNWCCHGAVTVTQHHLCRTSNAAAFLSQHSRCHSHAAAFYAPGLASPLSRWTRNTRSPLANAEHAQEEGSRKKGMVVFLGGGEGCVFENVFFEWVARSVVYIHISETGV